MRSHDSSRKSTEKPNACTGPTHKGHGIMKRKQRLLDNDDMMALVKLLQTELKLAYAELDRIDQKLEDHHRRIVLLLKDSLGIKKDPT